jgi:hypothetical protein
LPHLQPPSIVDPVVAEPRRFLRWHRSTKPKVEHPFSSTSVRRKAAVTVVPISPPLKARRRPPFIVARRHITVGKDRLVLLFALVLSLSTVVTSFVVAGCLPLPFLVVVAIGEFVVAFSLSRSCPLSLEHRHSVLVAILSLLPVTMLSLASASSQAIAKSI